MCFLTLTGDIGISMTFFRKAKSAVVGKGFFSPF